MLLLCSCRHMVQMWITAALVPHLVCNTFCCCCSCCCPGCHILSADTLLLYASYTYCIFCQCWADSFGHVHKGANQMHAKLKAGTFLAFDGLLVIFFWHMKLDMSIHLGSVWQYKISLLTLCYSEDGAIQAEHCHINALLWPHLPFPKFNISFPDDSEGSIFRGVGVSSCNEPSPTWDGLKRRRDRGSSSSSQSVSVFVLFFVFSSSSHSVSLSLCISGSCPRQCLQSV